MPADYGHVVHRGAEGETTEWDDIHARLGNAPPRASPRAPPAPFAPRAEEEDEARALAAAPSRSVATARVDALGADALEEEEDDDAFADDAFLETYRCATRRDATRRERCGGRRDDERMGRWGEARREVFKGFDARGGRVDARGGWMWE